MSESEAGIEPRPEPRGMTLPDVMMLSVGVATAFGVARLPGGSSFILGAMSPQGMLILMGLLIIWAVACGISAAALGRSAQFRRWLEPGEQLVLLLTALGIAALHGRRDGPFEQNLVQHYGWSFRQARWLVAAGWTLILVAGLPILVPLRRPGLRWAHALVGLILTVIAVSGPFMEITRDGPMMLAPVGGFAQTPAGLTVIETLERVAATPLGLLVAFPSAALLAAFRQRRVTAWPGWVGPILAWPILLYELILGPTFFPPGSALWFVGRVFRLAWTAGEWWFAGRVLRWWNKAQPGIGSPAAINSAT